MGLEHGVLVLQKVTVKVLKGAIRYVAIVTILFLSVHYIYAPLAVTMFLP